MREIRLSGSEGGGPKPIASPYPYLTMHIDVCRGASAGKGMQRCNPIHRTYGIRCYGHWIAEKVRRQSRRLEAIRVWVYQLQG